MQSKENGRPGENGTAATSTDLVGESGNQSTPGARQNVTPFAAVHWARDAAPTVRDRRGRPDTTAHHVLAVLATYADGTTGMNARPSVATLAQGTRLADRTVREALKRLEGAGLIARDGKHGDVTVWRLRLDRKDDVRSEAETARARRRERDARRLRNWRQAQRGDAETSSEGVTETLSDDVSGADLGQRNVVGGRYETSSEDVTKRRQTTDETSSDAGNLPETYPDTTCQQDLPPSAPHRGERSTGRGASPAPAARGGVDDDAGPERERDEWDELADEMADSEPASPAVVVESKEGTDGEDQEPAPALSPRPAAEDADAWGHNAYKKLMSRPNADALRSQWSPASLADFKRRADNGDEVAYRRLERRGLLGDDQPSGRARKAYDAARQADGLLGLNKIIGQASKEKLLEQKVDGLTLQEHLQVRAQELDAAQ